MSQNALTWMDCLCLAVMTSNQYPIESSWLKYYILEPIDQQPTKNKAPAIINIELIKIYKIIVSFFNAWQNMSKVYVETLSKHKQFSQDVSDKGISVMYLEVFFHQMEITRVDNNVSKFFRKVSNYLVSIYCCTHIHYDSDIFWIHKYCQLLNICKIQPYCLEIGCIGCYQ